MPELDAPELNLSLECRIFFGDSVDVQVRFATLRLAPAEDGVVVELAESTGKVPLFVWLEAEFIKVGFMQVFTTYVLDSTLSDL